MVWLTLVFGIATKNFAVQAQNAQPDKATDINMTVTDGPYVKINQDKFNVSWLCQSKPKSIEVAKTALPYDFARCNINADLYQTQFNDSPLEYNGKFKVAALSDLHGQYDIMITLLTNNGIIDQQGHWSFGNGHFVITGDIFDRGDKVTEILWFIHKLEQQAEQAGGKLHLLLGNHEVMVLNGDLRYLHPKYQTVEKLLEQPFEQLFGTDTVLGRWLRSKSVLVKVNDMLFAHGGFHPDLAKQKRTLQEINQTFKQNLVKSSLASPRRGWAKYLHKTNGPIWYRGYFKESGATGAEVDLLLNHFDVAHLVVGHTSMKTIETRYQGKVIAIDSSIKRGQYGEILLVNGNKKWRGSLSGKRLAL